MLEEASDDELPRLGPNEQLAGRFTVLRFIARGGMGAVYEANDAILRTRVALKVLQGKIVANAEVLERFRREVLLARRVGHPNVCRVYELYPSTTASGAGCHFLTMEFLDGETLASRIARAGRLTTAEALPLALQMCSGLAAAHAEGIIHRDFKSSNVMLVPRSPEAPRTSGEGTRVAITDFGIARAVVESSSEANALTGDAGVVGTPEYMAPEQVTGGEVSQATDVYALGIVLYEMVTGRLPFSSDTPLATASRRLNEPPPKPEATVPGLDPRWSRTILRCLDRDPRRRFQSANAVGDSLVAHTLPRRWPMVLAAVALLGILLAAVGLVRQRAVPLAASKAANAAPVAPSIAVLPFLDMSPEHDQGYFSDGVAEEIINALAQVPGLHVAARSSSFSFKGTSEKLRSVAQQLEVANVLEGSVRKSGNHLRVTAQLVSAQNGYQLWSRTFDSDLADVFAVQDQIASAVVEALKIKVLPDAAPLESGQKAIAPEAYTHYLRGLELAGTGTVPGARVAIEEFEKTLAIAPGYAPAHSRLAEGAFSYANYLDDGFEMREWSLRAIAEANRAVELDPTSADALTTRGIIRTGVTFDWAGSRADFDRAIALTPGSAKPHVGRGMLLAVFGELPAAIDELKTALQFDPLGAETLQTLGSLYNSAGRYALARETLTKLLQRAPQHSLGKRELVYTEVLDGHPKEALAIVKSSQQEWVRLIGTALAEHSLGNEAASTTALKALIAGYGSTAGYQVAQVFAWRGERDTAFDWLKKARMANDAGIRYMKYDPFLKSLRGDPRYAALLAEVGLPSN
jgi:TolB-like protein/Flp pilus assembly protein TadD/tRNA A-37 threonylcarbamoyl transferase component Bud32